jgi:predicted SAM-dependent methyltransferase
MYESLKNILPRNFLKTNEAFIRKMIYWFYKGSNKQCTVCEKKLQRFVTLKNGDHLCPYCGSLPRHRKLWILLKPFLLPGIKILDFSPPLCIYNKLKSLQEIDYTATDYEGEFAADRSFDITRIHQPADNFDWIICYHILEHIIDDRKAITELYRVLKPQGKCFIQTPFKEGDIYEDQSKQSKQERKQAFGQEDHVRIYSVQGLKQRLEKAGFQVEVLSFSNPEDNLFGFSTIEHVLLATK